MERESGGGVDKSSIKSLVLQNQQSKDGGGVKVRAFPDRANVSQESKHHRATKDQQSRQQQQQLGGEKPEQQQLQQPKQQKSITWVEIIESKDLYQENIRPYYSQQPLSRFLVELFTKGEVGGLRLVDRFFYGQRDRILYKNWLFAPHPIEARDLDWSGDVKFSMSAWWVHPELQICRDLWPQSSAPKASGRSTIEHVADDEKSENDKGGRDKFSQPQKASPLLKPIHQKSESRRLHYLHCSRDLVRSDVDQLRAVQKIGIKLMRTLLRRGMRRRGEGKQGGGEGSEGADSIPSPITEKDIRVYVNYPSAEGLSTLHVNFSYGFKPHYHSQVSRMHDINSVLAALEENGRWEPPELRYMMKSYWGMATKTHVLKSCVTGRTYVEECEDCVIVTKVIVATCLSLICEDLNKRVSDRQASLASWVAMVAGWVETNRKEERKKLCLTTTSPKCCMGCMALATKCETQCLEQKTTRTHCDVKQHDEKLAFMASTVVRTQ
eukprot:jgi/Bigna1/81085/fgenesh1_pg.77_\